MNVMQQQVHAIVNRYLFDGLRDRRDTLALQVLAPLTSSYLPWSQAAMRPTAIVALLNEIIINRRSSIVECGGGISTFYIGRLLQERGGHIFSVEHDAEWAEILRQGIETEGLGPWVTILHAPLVQSELAWADEKWYDPQALGPIFESARTDMLLVDGPPASSHNLRHSRYPAAPFFKRHLAVDFTVVLDDINRLAEQEIAERWEADLGIRFDRRFVDGSIAIGRSHASFIV